MSFTQWRHEFERRRQWKSGCIIESLVAVLMLHESRHLCHSRSVADEVTSGLFSIDQPMMKSRKVTVRAPLSGSVSRLGSKGESVGQFVQWFHRELAFLVVRPMWVRVSRERIEGGGSGEGLLIVVGVVAAVIDIDVFGY